MNELALRFAQLLRTSRQSANLSQDQLAAKAGVSRASIANYEIAGQSPSLEHAVLLAMTLNFSLDGLKSTESRKLIELELNEVGPKLREEILKTLKD